MATHEIVVVSDDLRCLAQRMTNSAQHLHGLCSPRASGLSAPVEQAFSSLAGRWDRQRAELADELTQIADLLGQVADVFEGSDVELAGSLRGGGGGGGGGR